VPAPLRQGLSEEEGGGVMKIVLMYRTFLDSFISDIITFSGLAGMFWVNKEYLSSVIPEWVLAGMFLLGTFGRIKMREGKHYFTNKKDAIKAIEEFYGEASDGEEK
jgi:membrane protein CcdC involved in cytochrome C biogenesis